MVIEVLGNRARTEILRRLHVPKTATELAAELGLSRASVHRHLLLLEQHEYVRGDVPPNERAQRQSVTRWSRDPEKIRSAAQMWGDYASGVPVVDD